MSNLNDLNLIKKNMDRFYSLKPIDISSSGSECEVAFYKNFCIKSYYTKRDALRSYDILKDLQGLEFIPKVYILDKNVLVCEKIEGKTLNSLPKEQAMKVVEEQFKGIVDEIMSNGYAPNDLHNENLMVDTNGKLRVIDVGYFDDMVDMDINYGYKDAFAYLQEDYLDLKYENVMLK